MSEHFQKVTSDIFDVSITTVQGLKNVSRKVWEELNTQSRYPIKDAYPPGIHQIHIHPYFNVLCFLMIKQEHFRNFQYAKMKIL
jgi:hypothetical protein